MIAAWMIGQQNTPVRPVYLTNYPHYLQRNTQGDFYNWGNVSAGAADPNNATYIFNEVIQYVAAVNLQRRANGQPDLNTIDAWFNDQMGQNGNPADNRSRLRFIYNYVRQALPEICGTMNDFIPFLGNFTYWSRVVFIHTVTVAAALQSTDDSTPLVKAPTVNVAYRDSTRFVNHESMWTNNAWTYQKSPWNKSWTAWREEMLQISLRHHERSTTTEMISSWDLVETTENDDNDDASNSGWENLSQASCNDTISTVADQSCYVASNKLKNPPAGQNVIQVPDSNPLRFLLDNLLWKLFVLSKTPEDGKVVNNIPFALKDNWTEWFKVALPVTGDILSISADTWPLKTNMPSFTVYLKGLVDESTPLVMNTANAAEALGVDSPALTKALQKYNSLAFGLQTVGASPKETTLGNLAQLINFPHRDLIDSSILKDIKLTFDSSNGARNALWFNPMSNYNTALRLQFSVLGDDLAKFLADAVPGFQINRVTLIAKKTAYHSPGQTDYATSTGEMTLLLMGTVLKGNPDFEFGYTASVRFAESSITIRLELNSRTSLPAIWAFKSDQEQDDELKRRILGWLGSKLDISDLPLNDWLETGASYLPAIKPRVLELTMGYDQAKRKLTAPDEMHLSLQLRFAVGSSVADSTRPVFFFATFGWSKTLGPYFRGDLWCNLPKEVAILRSLPEWEDYLNLEPDQGPTDPKNPPPAPIENLSLKSLLDIPYLPSGIPDLITRANIEIDKNGFSFGGTLNTAPPKEGKTPKIVLEELELDASFGWSGNKKFELSLGVHMLLFAGGAPAEDVDAQDQDTAKLVGSVAYQNQEWILTAEVSNLQVKHIASFFSDEIRDAAMSMIGKLSIDYLLLEYHYAKEEQGAGRSFLFTGLFSFGELQLNINFKNDGDNPWLFKLDVGGKGNDNGSSTIRSILTDLMGFKPDLPDAILDIEISKPTDEGNELLSFMCSELKYTKDGKASKLLTFVGSIHLKHITFTFVQYRDNSWPKGTPSRRIIKASISEIGPVEAPLVGELKQPFDQMYYMWVQDETKLSTKPGITNAEFEALNGILSAKDKLFFRKIKETYPPDSLVIEAGSHFVIVNKDSKGAQTAVLDYVFGKKEPPRLLIYEEDYDVITIEEDPMDKGGDKAMVPYKKSAGPLSISNIGLEYKENRLSVVLDATFLLGPIELALLGFGVSFKLGKQTKSITSSKKFNNRNEMKTQEFAISELKVELSGLAVAFDRPPLTVAGGFRHMVMDDFDCYAGGLIVAFKPWMIQAMGVYSKFPRQEANKPVDPSKKPFTMILIILKVEGPLFSVGWADISGLTAGFGVNSVVTPPTVKTVTSFPFVRSDGVDSGASAISTLQSLMENKWFTPREGCFWVAAGLKATAFQMLSIDAVVVVELNPDIRLGIYGVAVFDAPSQKSPIKFAHVELGIVCVLDIQAGVFKVEAQLSPNSYILHPSCHLTGGFALYSWFKTRDGAMAGDWVLTIGGYHQAFNVPSQYPKPPRLGISWALASTLSITGEAYFAITPKVCMGGGKLHAALNLGPLSAWFDASLDFLINYQPFHFSAVGKISVGVRFTMDLWIVTIRINVEIGAVLTVAGPPMAGIVHVDFWVFGFDIKFGGNMALKPPPLPVGDFMKLVLDSATNSGSALPVANFQRQLTDAPKAKPTTQPIIFNCKEGLIPQDEEKKTKSKTEAEIEKPWVVKGGILQFTISFKFPISQVTIEDRRWVDILKTDSTNEPKKDPVHFMPGDSIHALPMQLEPTQKIKSSATVNITQPTVVFLRDIPEEPRKEGEWRVQSELKPAQRSIWGSCKCNSIGLRKWKLIDGR
jgi:hypothetical protein